MGLAADVGRPEEVAGDVQHRATPSEPGCVDDVHARQHRSAADRRQLLHRPRAVPRAVCRCGDHHRAVDAIHTDQQLVALVAEIDPVGVESNLDVVERGEHADAPQLLDVARVGDERQRHAASVDGTFGPTAGQARRSNTKARPLPAPRTRGPACGAVRASSGAPSPHTCRSCRQRSGQAFALMPFITPYMACTRAMATKPTMRPTNTIISGSNIVVNFLMRLSSSRSKYRLATSS